MPSDSAISGLVNECTDPALTDYLAIDDGSAANETKKITIANLLGGITGDVVINEAGADYDFRVESDNIQNIIHVDASADILECLGTLTVPDSSMWSAVLARVGKNMIANGTAVASSANEGLFQVQSTIPITVASQASYCKSGIYVHVSTLDPSTYGPDILNDAVGIVAQGLIGDGNTLGRAWGLGAYARTAGTGDGLLCAFEADVNHGGSDQPLLDQTTSKYGIQIVTQDHDSTCGLRIIGTGGSLWHKGIRIETTSLDTESGDSAIEIGSVLRVLPSGAIIVGTENASEVILGMSANTAGHEGVSLQHDGTEAFLTAIDCGTAWHDFTVVANAFRLDLNGGTNTHVFGSTGLHAQETYCVRKVVTKTGLADNVATEVFTITTTNEAGNTDGGVYSVKVHAICSHGTANDGTKNSCKSFQAAFARAMTSTGVGANSAVTEVWETASAAPDAGVKDVVAITMTVAETSEYITSVLFQVDISGSTTTTADVMALVEVVYAGFLTPPVIA